MSVQVSLFAGGSVFTEGSLCVAMCCVLVNARPHTWTVPVSCGASGGVNMPACTEMGEESVFLGCASVFVYMCLSPYGECSRVCLSQ